jgi:hypothetical protein
MIQVKILVGGTKSLGNEDEALRNIVALEKAIRFCMKLQFMPENVLYLAQPNLALGGVRRSSSDWRIRIDYVQHTLSAILGLQRAKAAFN